MLLFTNCKSGDEKKDIIQLLSANPTLYYDDEFQIEATSVAPITYKTENEYHATVSASGLVTAKRIGSTSIILDNGSDTQNLLVTVKPKSNLYPEPNVDFGVSRAFIISKYGTPDAEDDNIIGYNSYSSKAPILMFVFDESDKLKASTVMVKTAYSSELGDFLVERYASIGVDDEDFTVFLVNGLNKDTITMAVGASLYNLSYWMVMYFPFTVTRGDTETDHEEVRSAIDELMLQLQ